MYYNQFNNMLVNGGVIMQDVFPSNQELNEILATDRYNVWISLDVKI